MRILRQLLLLAAIPAAQVLAAREHDIPQNDPAYSSKLGGDGYGIACES
jgi:Excalibur calcium-binding domain